MKSLTIKIILIVLIALLGFFIPNIATAQTVKHHSYITYYNAKTGQPDSVSWTLKASMLSCKTPLARKNVFIADPSIPNTKFNIFYEGSGYDQGHQFDADDASCSQIDENECWYFSNMVPQCPNLNRITWRELENHSRKLADTIDVKITCGVMGSLGKLVGVDKHKNKHPSNINIPAYCWKRLTYGNKTEYYVMPNKASIIDYPYTHYLVRQ